MTLSSEQGDRSKSGDNGALSAHTASTTLLHVQCHCRQQTIPLRVPPSALPLPVEMCHCDDCRLTTGMLANDFVCLDGIIKEDLFDPSTPQGLPPGLVGYTPTRVTWYFCAMCGAHLLQSYPRAATGKDDKTHHQWFLSPGTLYPVSVPAITAIAEEGGLGREKAAAAAAAVPEEHIMVFKRNKHIWVRPKRDQGGLAKFLAHDGLPRYKSQHCEKPDQRLAPGQTECDGDEDRGRAVELAIHMAASAPTLPLRCRCGHVRLTLQRPEARPVASKWQTTASSDGKRWVWGFCVCNACRATSGYEHSAFLFCPYSHLDRNGSGSGSGSGDDWAIAAGPAMQTQTQIEGTSTALSPMSSTHPGAKDLVGDPRYPATAGLRDYRSNADGHRRFCPYCGAIVLLDYDDRGELVDVYLGAVDAPLAALFDAWSFPRPYISYFSCARNKPQAEELRLGFCPDNPCIETERQKASADPYPGGLVL